MLLPEIELYLKKVETTIRQMSDVNIERYEEELLTPDRVNLRVRIRFKYGYLLEINEAIISEEGMVRHLDYRYHFQNDKNQLIFRFDNTPHHPEIASFPNHKHIFDTIEFSRRPSIHEVVELVKKNLTNDAAKEK